MTAWLTQPLQDALRSHNIEELFPLQLRCASYILQAATSNISADVCIASPTGSGKTLCYVLPIIQYLARHMSSNVQCLILLPTKDTAQEVYNVFQSLAEHTYLHTALLCGSLSLEAEQQMLRNSISSLGLQLRCAHIVIGTPRRVLDHVDTFPDLLQCVRFLVIDEADALLSPSNSDWVYKLMNAMTRTQDRTLHKVLCSATLTSSLPLYAHMGMNNVTMFQNDRIGEEGPGLMMDVFTLPETLTEYLIHVAEEDKLGVLVALLEKYHVREKSDEVILVFCSSVVRTHRIHRFLSVAGFSSCEFSRNLSHRQRMSNMNALLREENTVKSNVVVATDVLGRGIDLSQKVSVVIQYDAPVDAKTYLHRCGRTARAKRSGIAITLADPACLEFMEHLRAQLKPDKILPLLDVDGDRKKLHTQMLTQALSTLQKVLEMEDSRNLQPTDPIPSNCVLNIFPSSADNASTAYGGDDAPTTRKQRPQRIDFQWICSICKYTNLPRNSDQCHRCTTPRNGTEKKYTGAMEKAMHGGMWKCKQCNARGLPRDLSCSKCHKTRTSFDPIMFFGPAILKRGPEESVAEDA